MTLCSRKTYGWMASNGGCSKSWKIESKVCDSIDECADNGNTHCCVVKSDTISLCGVMNRRVGYVRTERLKSYGVESSRRISGSCYEDSARHTVFNAYGVVVEDRAKAVVTQLTYREKGAGER